MRRRSHRVRTSLLPRSPYIGSGFGVVGLEETVCALGGDLGSRGQRPEVASSRSGQVAPRSELWSRRLVGCTGLGLARLDCPSLASPRHPQQIPLIIGTRHPALQPRPWIALHVSKQRSFPENKPWTEVMIYCTVSSETNASRHSRFSGSCIGDPRSGSLCKALTSLHRFGDRGFSFSSSHHTS